MTPVSVILRCNDQHGNSEGCVRRLEFGEAITLEAIAPDHPPRVSFVRFGPLVRLLRISGKVFPLRAYFPCNPEPHTDSVVMEAEVAAAFLNFLKSRGAFEPHHATLSTWDVWHAEGGQFSAQGLEAACAE